MVSCPVIMFVLKTLYALLGRVLSLLYYFKVNLVQGLLSACLQRFQLNCVLMQFSFCWQMFFYFYSAPKDRECYYH